MATTLKAPLPRSGRYAVLFRTLITDAGQPIVVTVTVDGVTIHSETHTLASDFDNLDNGAQMPNGVVFVASDAQAGRTATVTVDETSGTATLGDCKVIAPSACGIPELDWHGVHCAPRACVWDGKVARIAVEAGTAKRYLIWGEASYGELFSSVAAAQRQPEDKYHQGSAIIPCADGLACLMTDHQQRLYLTWVSTPGATPTAVTELETNTTYVHATCASTSATTLYVVTRDSSKLTLIEVDLSDVNAPTTTTDVLCNTQSAGARPYPRHLELLTDSASAQVLGIGYQMRVTGGTEAWEDIGVIFYETATRQCRNVRAEDAGGTTLGTTSTPKLTNAQVYTGPYSSAGNMSLVDVLSSGTRYAPAGMAMRSSTVETFDVAAVFVDSTEITDSAVTTCDVRLVWYAGADARYVTGATSNVFGLDDADSFRLTGVTRWANADTSSDSLEVVLGAFEAGELAAADYTDDYNWFGAKNKIHEYTVDVSSIASALNLENAVSEAGIYTYTSAHSCRVSAVQGDADGYMVEISQDAIDEVWGTQAVLYVGRPAYERNAPTLAEIIGEIDPLRRAIMSGGGR